MAKGVKVQVGEADRVPGLGPGLAEPRPTQPAASRANEDQAVFTWLGESLQVPAELMRDLSRERDPASPGLRLGIVVNQPAVVGLGRQGGASGAAGPSSAPNSASRRPARRTQGHTPAC
jgi:hypothetical protein